jgi:hypothetical protein
VRTSPRGCRYKWLQPLVLLRATPQLRATPPVFWGCQIEATSRHFLEYPETVAHVSRQVHARNAHAHLVWDYLARCRTGRLTPQRCSFGSPESVCLCVNVCSEICVCLCVNVCSEILGLCSPRKSGYAFSSTLAFSLRLMPLGLAIGATPSFQAPPLLRPHSSPPPNWFILFTCPLHLGLHYVHLTWRLR